jgi:hypothetical protein
MRKLFQTVFEGALFALRTTLRTTLVLIWVIPASQAFADAGQASCRSWQRPDGYDESWIPVSFKASCVSHIKCYETPDAGWSSCNTEFYTSLRKSCDAMFPHAALSAAGSKSGEEEGSAEGALISCLQVADEFYAKVQSPAVLKQFQGLQEKPNHQAPAL